MKNRNNSVGSLAFARLGIGNIGNLMHLALGAILIALIAMAIFAPAQARANGGCRAILYLGSDAQGNPLQVGVGTNNDMGISFIGIRCVHGKSHSWPSEWDSRCFTCTTNGADFCDGDQLDVILYMKTTDGTIGYIKGWAIDGTESSSPVVIPTGPDGYTVPGPDFTLHFICGPGNSTVQISAVENSTGGGGTGNLPEAGHTNVPPTEVESVSIRKAARSSGLAAAGRPSAYILKTSDIPDLVEQVADRWRNRLVLASV